MPFNKVAGTLGDSFNTITEATTCSNWWWDGGVVEFDYYPHDDALQPEFHFDDAEA